MTQVFNFCAGPAMLPTDVMKQAQSEFVNWSNTGCSVMELSHRSSLFVDVATRAESDLRDLLKVPDNYSILFMHGGGRGQFSAVPLNLLGDKDTADYAVTGSWSKAAAEEATKFVKNTNIATDLYESNGLRGVQPVKDWKLSDDAAFLHLCTNETVDGIRLKELPNTEVPIVSDMSSCILSEVIDINDYGVIYAGAQKNIGPSGITIVIVRNDLLNKAQKNTPSIQDFTLTAKKHSMFNTPPTFAWYLAGLVFMWLKAQGGVEAIQSTNAEKARLLYEAIDNSDFYSNSIAPENRSLMNVPFQLAQPELDKAFLLQAEKSGLLALAGHRSVGGMRASIYNAMPVEGIHALVKFMHKFEKENT